MIASLFGGGFAGLMFFMIAYPFDYMKTLFQTDNLKKPEYSSLLDCFKKRIKAGGVSTFYKGMLVTLNRGFFVNAGGFFAFELSMRCLGRSS